jgi:hypothetical protein
MDVWFQLKKQDISGAIALMMPHIAAHFGISENEARVSKRVEKFIVAASKDTMTDPAGEESLRSRYRAAVESLAPFEPMLAYRLSGKTEIGDLGGMYKYFSRVVQQAESEGDIQKRGFVERLIPYWETKLYTAAVATVEEDILAVASAISWLTRWKLKLTLSYLKNQYKEKFSEVLRSYLHYASETLDIGQRSPPEAER